RKDEIAQEENAARRKQRCHPAEGDDLPKVRQMVQRVPGVDEAGAITRVPIGEEARLHALDVRRAGGSRSTSDRLDHRGRDVNSDHPLASRRRRDRKYAGAGAEVDQRAARTEAPSAQCLQVFSGIEACFPVVSRDVDGIEVLGPSKLDLPETLIAQLRVE